MRYLRMRLRSSILFGLITLTFISIFTLYILIWSAIELEKRRDEINNELLHFQPPKDISFWSALDQTNVYDLQATVKIKPHLSSHRTSKQINDLYAFINQNYNSKPLIKLNLKMSFNFTTVKENSLTEQDKIQLRDFAQYSILKWKDNHRNDSIRSLADIMHDNLAQDEPMYVYFIT